MTLINGPINYDGEVFLAADDTDEIPDPYNKAPNYISMTENEKYIPSNSTISYNFVDAVIPGVNGLDLVIGRNYSSAIDLYYGNIEIDHFQKAHGLGIGWSFMFSSIELQSWQNVILHTSDGGAYQVRYSKENGFDNHTLKDMILREDTGDREYVSPLSGVYSAYIVEYKNGNKEYFDGNGKLICIEDRYGNRIQFEYSYTVFGGANGQGADKEYTITITDTLNRKTYIKKTHINDTESQILVELPSGEFLRYMTEQTDCTFTIGSSLTSQASTKHAYVLKSFEDQEQYKDNSLGKTVYGYQKLPIEWNKSDKVQKAPDKNGHTYAYPLSSIYFPSSYGEHTDEANQESVLYWYSTTSIGFGKYGFDQTPFMQTRTIHANNYAVSGFNIQKNLKAPNFTDYDPEVGTTNSTNGTIANEYTNEGVYYVGDMRAPGDPNDDAVDYYNIKYTFNTDYLAIKEETTTKPGEYMRVIEREYNSDKLPIKIVTKDYNDSGEYAETVEAFKYDKYGNVVAYWPIMPYSETNDNYKVSYTFDTGNYNQPLSVTYKIDGNQTVEEKYSLKNDKKGVETRTVSVGGVLKEKTGYTYDTYGNITGIRKYYTNTTLKTV
jgi:hypothetical protein